MELDYTLTYKQTKAFDYLVNDKNLAICFGGAKGGGKSFLLCIWVLHWIEWLCNYFGLEETDNPLKYIPLGFIGRKRSVDFTKTTFETFKRVIPSDIYKLNKQEKEIVFFNKAKIFYGGLDDEKNINKFNSAELAFTAIDQAEETTRNDVGVLQASLRFTHKGKKPPFKELYTANPAECWLRHDFVKGNRSDGIYIPALYKENPHLPPDYGQTLEKAFSYDPVLLAAYRDGDWDLIQAENLFITSRMLDDLHNIERFHPDIKRLIVCDPSEGGDECVIMAMENRYITEMMILHEKDTMKVAGHMIAMANKHDTDNYVIDNIGIGKGIFDRLSEQGEKRGWNIIGIRSSEKANDDTTYANKKTEIWDYVSEVVRAKECYPIEDEETVRQLTCVKYRILSNGKKQILPKQTIKKDVGRSPDRADAYIMGIWAHQFIATTPKGVEQSCNYSKRTLQSSGKRLTEKRTVRV